MGEKIRVAVIFGGRSVEHDVSVLTGLQCLEALDPAKYEGFPVYVDAQGTWWTGEALMERRNYPIAGKEEGWNKKGLLRAVTLDLSSASRTGQAMLLAEKAGLLSTKIEEIPFDIMIPAIHGSNGEDGSLQGLLSFAAIPFTGSRQLGASLAMDKLAAKTLARNAGLHVLDCAVVERPADGSFLAEEALQPLLSKELGGHNFPFIVKPRHLGSSVGVSRVDNMDALIAGLVTVFRLDTHAMIEPYVEPLVEYNIAVRRGTDGVVYTSAIEKPLSGAAVLDFKNKYLAGGPAKGPKLNPTGSEGMASLNRELNPALSEQQKRFIEESAKTLFSALDLAGSVRVDFLSNKDSGEIWFNEANTIPGSFAYFLWEAANPKLSFLGLTDAMIEEGLALSQSRKAQTDAKAGGATIFKEA